jgi:hypothetical protein
LQAKLESAELFTARNRNPPTVLDVVNRLNLRSTILDGKIGALDSSKDWLKIKSRPQQEFVVPGVTKGKKVVVNLPVCFCWALVAKASFTISDTPDRDSAKKASTAPPSDDAANRRSSPTARQPSEMLLNAS